MEPDHLGSLQLGAAGNRLRRVHAVMKKEGGEERDLRVTRRATAQ
jgi:hypothetical protein